MKKKIVVCCDEMLGQMISGLISNDLSKEPAILHRFSGSTSAYLVRITFCPFCSARLPFPYEEAE